MSRTEEIFDGVALFRQLQELPSCRRLLVGFSGGADSSALLLALHDVADRVAARIEAVHFNHGLHASADEWEAHCTRLCRKVSIPLHIHKLDLLRNNLGSSEDQARQARYSIVEQMLDANDIYLTAHHADDQAETLLINLMRGSGIDGIAGIPPLRNLAKGWIARPMLSFRRLALEKFLKSREIEWIEDPSNGDHIMDRNFIRGSLMPQLEQRWPGVNARLNSTARNARAAAKAMSDALDRIPGCTSADGTILPLQVFFNLSPELRAEVLRNWAREQGSPPPPRARLMEFLRQLAQAVPGKNAEIRWHDKLIKYHSEQLWMHTLPAPESCPGPFFTLADSIYLGFEHGYLHLDGLTGMTEISAWVGSREDISRNSENHASLNTKVKEIMRLTGVPPWLRNCVPVLLFEQKLAAVGDWWFSEHWLRVLDQKGLKYHWKPEHRLLQRIQANSHDLNVDPEPDVV
jgi:tRNA(Ile)-lysidine synthase